MLCSIEIHLFILCKLLIGVITIRREECCFLSSVLVVLVCLYPKSESDSMSLHLHKEKELHCRHAVFMAYCIAVNNY